MNLNIIGCSVPGFAHKTHKPEKIPCQDAFEIYQIVPGATMAVAVADGHGSSACKYSADGARLAAKIFCETMSNLFSSYDNDNTTLGTFLYRDGGIKIAQEIVSSWRTEVFELHKRQGREIQGIVDSTEDDEWKQVEKLYHLYGTTLVGMFITPEFHYAFQIGDGDITQIKDHHASAVIESDQILGVETHSLCERYPWRKVHSELIHVNGEFNYSYILSSDGFKNSHASQEEYYRSCEEYIAAIREYGQLKVTSALSSWLSETSQYGCGDDITVAIVDSFDPANEKEETTIEVKAEKAADNPQVSYLAISEENIQKEDTKCEEIVEKQQPDSKDSLESLEESVTTDEEYLVEQCGADEELTIEERDYSPDDQENKEIDDHAESQLYHNEDEFVNELAFESDSKMNNNDIKNETESVITQINNNPFI